MIIDNLAGPQTQTFSYDSLNRLTSANATGGTNGLYNESYSYSAGTGNLLVKAGETYAYDANGNMTQRIENGLTYTQTFDAENRLISVTVSGQTTQFIYDGDGNLIKKIKPDGSKTLYVGGLYEVDKTSSGTVTKTTVYYPESDAMRVDGVLYYLLKDHLGSTVATTDASGNIIGETRYSPFGEMRFTTGNILTDRLYTGQRAMAGLGIYHYGARFYSPSLDRFLSPDSIVPDTDNPQAWNRYSYVYNNPIRFIDPTGHSPACDDGDWDGCPIRTPPTTPTNTGGRTGGRTGGGGSGGRSNPSPTNNPPALNLPVTNPGDEPVSVPPIITGPVGGPILGPIILPGEKPNVCQQFESQYYAVLGIILTIDTRINDLIKKLDDTNDSKEKERIRDKILELLKERAQQKRKLFSIKDAAHRAGCSVSGWFIPEDY